MKNKKFAAATISAALVASVVAPIASEAATGQATTKTNIKDVKLYSATKVKVYYTASNGKTASKDVVLNTPIKHLSTYAMIPWEGKNVRWNFHERVQLPQQKSYAKYIALAKSDVAAGNADSAAANLEIAKAHLNNMDAAHFSPSTLENYKTSVATVEKQIEELKGQDKEQDVKKVISTVSTSPTTVEVTYDRELETIEGLKFTIDGLAISRVAFKPNNKKTIVLTTSEQSEMSYTVKESGVAVGIFTGIENPAVKSVQALNAKEIKVTFNREVNKDSAEVAANYVITYGKDSMKKAAGTYVAKLQDDKKSVILQLTKGNELANGEAYKVDVKNVLASNYVAFPEFKGVSAVFSDKTAPKLVSTAFKGGVLTLTFDEPIKIAPTLKVDGITAPAGTLSTEAGDYTVKYTITDADMLRNGTHNIMIYSAEDYAGNVEAVIHSSYVASADNTKPAVEKVEAVSTNTFRVTLSTVPSAALTAANFEVKKGNFTFPSSRINVAPYGTTGKVFNVTIVTPAGDLNPLYAANETSVALSVTVKNFKGINNVFADAYTATVQLMKDTARPVVQNAAINTTAGQKQLVVIFNKDLSTVDVSKIAVTKDGIKQTLTAASIDPTDTKKLVITLANTLTDGTYQVAMGDSAVQDMAGNGNAALNTTVTAKVASGTALLLADSAVKVTKAANGQNVVTITYGQEMGVSALDLANYKMDGIMLNNPLYAGINIAFTTSAKNEVEITLPKGQVVSTAAPAVFEISKNVLTAAGQFVAKGVNEATFTTTLTTLTDDVAPVLKTAEFVRASSADTSAKIVKLTFSEAVTATDAKDFLVTVGGTVVPTTITSGTATKEVLLTLATEVNVAQAGTVAITTDRAYNTDGEINITDAAGNKADVKVVNIEATIVDNTAVKASAIAAANTELANLTITNVDGTNFAVAKAQVEAAQAKVNAARALGAFDLEFNQTNFPKLAVQRAAVENFGLEIATVAALPNVDAGSITEKNVLVDDLTVVNKLGTEVTTVVVTLNDGTTYTVDVVKPWTAKSGVIYNKDAAGTYAYEAAIALTQTHKVFADSTPALIKNTVGKKAEVNVVVRP